MAEDNFTRDEDGDLTPTKDGKKRLRSIGSTPIVNKDYNPACMTSFVVGFIRLVKEEGSWQREPNSSVLDRLIGDGDCVDKVIITEVIDLSTNYASDLDSAAFAATLLTYILCDDVTDVTYPSDTRIAFAIREGLIDICLNFIRRFGLHESFLREKDGDSLNSDILYILNVISGISLHKKTAKAIRHKRSSIENELVRLEQNTNITNNCDCRMLLDKVKSILSLSGSYCCQCNKSLTKTEVMECNGCHRMAYCSRACQKEDWSNGHKLTCSTPCMEETLGQFQGRVLPEEVLNNEWDTSKMKELEINANMIQLKLFLDHSETILKQASSLGIPLSDCVVSFDLRDCPLEIGVYNYTEFYSKPEHLMGFESSRSKKNITCLFGSYFYESSYCFNGTEGGDTLTIMQRFFPHEWLTKQRTDAHIMEDIILILEKSLLCKDFFITNG